MQILTVQILFINRKIPPLSYCYMPDPKKCTVKEKDIVIIPLKNSKAFGQVIAIIEKNSIDRSVNIDGKPYSIRFIEKVIPLSNEYIIFMKKIASSYGMDGWWIYEQIPFNNKFLKRKNKKESTQNEKNNCLKKSSLPNFHSNPFDSWLSERRSVPFLCDRFLKNDRESLINQLLLSKKKNPDFSSKILVYLSPCKDLLRERKKFFESFFSDDEIFIMRTPLHKVEERSLLDFFESEKEKKIKIIMGIHGCTFLPIPQIGLCIIEEIESENFIEIAPPFIHHGLTMMQRCKEEKIPLLLISLTAPIDIRIFILDQKKENVILGKNKYDSEKIELLSLYGKNLSKEELSLEIKEKINKIVTSKKQMLLFCNRKFFSSLAICSLCRKKIKCHCEKPFTFLSKIEAYCVSCKKKEPIPEHCHQCGGSNAFFFHYDYGIEGLLHLLKKSGISSDQWCVISDETTTNKDKEKKIKKILEGGPSPIIIGTKKIFSFFYLLKNVRTLLYFPIYGGQHTFLYDEKFFREWFFLKDKFSLQDSEMFIVDDKNLSHPLNHYKDHDLFFEKSVKIREQLNYPPHSIIGILFFQLNQNILSPIEEIKKNFPSIEWGMRGEKILGEKILYQYIFFKVQNENQLLEFGTWLIFFKKREELHREIFLVPHMEKH